VRGKSRINNTRRPLSRNDLVDHMSNNAIAGPPSEVSVRPIFVVGAARSGTTMLRYMLSSHPRIYIPPESNFIPRFFHQAHQPLSRERAIQTMRALHGYRMFFRDWHGPRPDPEGFVDSLPDLLPATFLDHLYGEYARQYGASRWGDKTPIYTEHIKLIAGIFPQAQFIHIIRDGRDVALSMRQAYAGLRFFYMDVYYAACTWKRRIRKTRADGAGLGAGRYLEVHYEQLASQPEQHLRRICEFLNEPYSPAMAEPHRTARERHHSKGIHAATRRAPNTSSAGHWRRDMSPADARIFQAAAGDLLNELGYETAELGAMSVREALRYTTLSAKYTLIEAGRRAAQSTGVFHPTQLLSKVLKPRRQLRRIVPHVTT